MWLAIRNDRHRYKLGSRLTVLASCDEGVSSILINRLGVRVIRIKSAIRPVPHNGTSRDLREIGVTGSRPPFKAYGRTRADTGLVGLK